MLAQSDEHTNIILIVYFIHTPYSMCIQNIQTSNRKLFERKSIKSTITHQSAENLIQHSRTFPTAIIQLNKPAENGQMFFGSQPKWFKKHHLQCNAPKGGMWNNDPSKI